MRTMVGNIVRMYYIYGTGTLFWGLLYIHVHDHLQSSSEVWRAICKGILLGLCTKPTIHILFTWSHTSFQIFIFTLKHICFYTFGIPTSVKSFSLINFKAWRSISFFCKFKIINIIQCILGVVTYKRTYLCESPTRSHALNSQLLKHTCTCTYNSYIMSTTKYFFS